MQKSEGMQSNQGKKEAYALHGTKPSGMLQRRVKPRGMNRIACFGDYKRSPKSFRGVTRKVKRDNEKCSKCAWREMSGQETRGLGVQGRAFMNSSSNTSERSDYHTVIRLHC